ncbi:MAG: hypothetical protein H0U73_05310 [Tatlockia sp.]|nr:hypothetical protein [Tatlockia sp.]
MHTKEGLGFFSEKSQSTVVDLINSPQENSQLLVNHSIQDEQQIIQVSNAFDFKQFLKSFLEQFKITAFTGAALVNLDIQAQTLMGHKFTIEDHKHLETFLLSCWGVRGVAAGLVALTGLNHKAPDAIAAFSLTENNVAKMLILANFFHKMPIDSSINSFLQIATSSMVLLDHGRSAQALAQGKADTSNLSYPEIKDRYQGQNAVIALMTLIEGLYRASQMGATSYTAFYTLADFFKDLNSLVDPANQKQILMILTFAMAILGALSVLNPISSQIANQIKSLLMYIGLVFLPLVSLMFDYLPKWLSSHGLEIGLIVLLGVVIPPMLEALVSIWPDQDKKEAEVNAQDEIKNIMEDFEDLTEQKREYSL